MPAGIKWGGTRYVVDPEYDNSYLANTFVGQWEAWKVRARLAALAAGHVLQQFTISASDRFELTGAVGLLRGFGCVGPAAALQRALEAESIRFNASGVDAAEAAQERLHTFLNEAAGAGFELGGVAAGNCTSTCSRSGTPQGFPPSSTRGRVMETFRVAYPFALEEYSGPKDGEFYDGKTWRPGIRFEVRGQRVSV